VRSPAQRRRLRGGPPGLVPAGDGPPAGRDRAVGDLDVGQIAEEEGAQDRAAVGDWLYNAALLGYVCSATGSAAWVGAATIARLMPYVLLGPFGVAATVTSMGSVDAHGVGGGGLRMR
jgi:hypothetical protein